MGGSKRVWAMQVQTTYTQPPINSFLWVEFPMEQSHVLNEPKAIAPLLHFKKSWIRHV